MNLNVYISNLPFGKLKEVGDLLFKEYPSTLVMTNDEGIPHIIEWVDVDEKGIDKYYIYRSSKGMLKQFVERIISHRELIKNNNEGFVFYFEGSFEKADTFQVVTVKNISNRHLPSITSYFDEDDSADIDSIVDFFNLEQVNLEEESTVKSGEIISIREYSSLYDTELVRLHLNTGKHISHGRVDTGVLGTVLSSFEELYHEVADDYFKGKDRQQKIKKDEKLRYSLSSSTEVVVNQAASFSVYIKPKGQFPRLNVGDVSDCNSPVVTEGDKIVNDVMRILKNSSSEDAIADIKDSFSSKVFSKLKEFATTVKKNDLDLDIDYYSPTSKLDLTDKIGVSIADRIIQTIENTYVQEDDYFQVKGKFLSINCKTGYVTFESIQEEEYNGYFIKMIRENMSQLNFVDLYQLTFERSVKKNIADATEKYTDNIVACIKTD